MNEILDKGELSFEDAMDHLESIVERLGSPNEKLDNLIVLYEEGVAYLRYCRKKLAEAETKISLLNTRMEKQAAEEDANG
jgi:exodeoxyribonuclease VII small subunit